MPLTKIECDRASCPQGKPYVRLADGQGMYLEVTAAGRKYWRLKYRHGGKEKRAATGRSRPTTGRGNQRVAKVAS